MEKRVLLAVVLSFVVLYGYQAMFPPPKPQPAAQSSATQSPGAQAAATQPGSAALDLEKQSAAAAPVPASAPVEALVADTADRDIVVENDSVRAVFATRGGVLKEWTLKHYKTDQTDQGVPLNLIPEKAPAGSAKPFTLTVDDAAVTTTLSQALFKPSADSLATGSAPASLVFEYRDVSGLSARKEFAFTPDQPYIIQFTATVTTPAGTQNPTVVWGPALGTGQVSGGFTYSPSSQPLFYRDGKVNRIGFDSIAENRTVEGNLGVAGADDHYFLTAIVQPPPVRVQYGAVPVPIEGTDDLLHFVDWSARFAEPPAGVKYFAGPKNFDVLASIDRDLVRAIDFGIFSPLVVPLLRALKWVNGYIGNFGWSIIALTVLINLAMFPLRHKSVVSMRKMQSLQPDIKAIQDRYSKLKMSDPGRQKMNVEMMNLYRERGVNPASGCVPMLLTLPVLFAFYSMLSVAIELRGAPFIGWITDLSVYDPWFVTPVLMGVTQFFQTKMTPSTADPQQQKIMMFMPLIFMSMFIWAPSGLVLYWTVSNLWAIGQQVVTNRLIGPTPQRTVRPPAERKLKNAGGGKSDGAKERK